MAADEHDVILIKCPECANVESEIVPRGAFPTPHAEHTCWFCAAKNSGRDFLWAYSREVNWRVVEPKGDA